MKNYKFTEKEQQQVNVLKSQSESLDEIRTKADAITERADKSIVQSERILKKYGKNPKKVPKRKSHLQIVKPIPELRCWAEIVEYAEKKIEHPALLSDILSPSEIKKVEERIALQRNEFNSIHRLDKLDWAICGVSGILAALIDIFLIQMPKYPGFLGGKATKGGPLANWIREKVNGAYSPEEIKKMEEKFWVPYDPSTSKELTKKINGLGPNTHRFQSLGHDPILGFIFGVKDILQKTFSAVDTNGKLIIQKVAIKDNSIVGMNIFQAIGRVFGHLKSDIATKSSLPVPLMPLFQFLQFGKIGRSEYTIGEVTRIMNRSGYDFNHFLAMSVSPLLIEILVRLCYFAKRMHESYSFLDSIPMNLPKSKRKPKLQTMLFSAHLVSTAVNGGKVYFSQNPLAINYPQWLATFNYLIPQLKWSLIDKEDERFRYVQKRMDEDWIRIDEDLSKTWEMVSMEPVYLK